MYLVMVVGGLMAWALAVAGAHAAGASRLAGRASAGPSGKV